MSDEENEAIDREYQRVKALAKHIQKQVDRAVPVTKPGPKFIYQPRTTPPPQPLENHSPATGHDDWRDSEGYKDSAHDHSDD